ncbi:class I SAM-dependent methyltransferase [Promicromonospora thailandica]|uniref:Methyltransferase domain-containing protein n=1 Tax=Promicromonospora thailandica TaxID=765201 RepID=A0A9X2G2K4_9MICO|nr:class I SAM-dependent methyltransferase [Promicromonospora thailandica]MCP2264533.1 Methyltransferase domain-containing protein [Promicromonospora thailandica]BFF20402.1 class I SAM-dependent methyltransferase [Promicromonospora thailandica]
MTSPEHLTTVRAGYDAKAQAYTDFATEAFAAKPLVHTMIRTFAELVGQTGGGLVADVGCGPGHVTRYLREHGVDAFGVDLSPELLAIARASNPGVRFELGDMGALDVPSGSLAGVVANYSLLHTPPEVLPGVLAELTRTLAPGGHLLAGFPALDDAGTHDAGTHAGGRTAVNAATFDHTVTRAWRFSVDDVADLLARDGAVEVARLVIAATEDVVRGFPQAHLLVRRTA